ncbi:hypothetical protein [Vreelandella maris]|uniref:Polysaccharide chain length determinant N-terminal domain-containing protein n=1 Tax=Vreelandella maris TaxID=2729617 RepID=A0A7Y6RB25_9GAMM|nr:hypothetical protein [Halomonas maris]NVF13654.1 hypothetical protein [Halomonas maris]
MEQPPRSTYQDDEVSLVDLAKILIRRRWWLIGTSVIVFLLAVMSTLLLQDGALYQYTSIYQQAEKKPSIPLNDSESLVQQVENLYWPNYQRSYKEENNVSVLPFDLEVSNPGNTILITLRSIAEEEVQGQVISLHEAILNSVVLHDENSLEKLKFKLEGNIELTSTLMERVESGDSYTAVEMAVNYADRLFKLESELDDLAKGEVLEYAVSGDVLEPTLSSSMIIVLGIIFGGVAGVIAAFFVEFVVRVRGSMKLDVIRSE